MKEAKRMSEPPAKKLVPKWDTLYPSKQELDWLANNEMWDQLEKRIKDKTRQNLIADAIARRKVSVEMDAVRDGVLREVPYDIARKIALNMDIRTLLDASNKLVLFQSFLVENGFWKQKFANDFPEVVYAMEKVGYDPEKVEVRSDRMREFKNTLWRRVYYVVRYIMVNMHFKDLADFKTTYTHAEYRGKNGIFFKFEYNKQNDTFKRTVYSKSNLDTDPIQIGDSSNLDREDFFRKHVSLGDITRINYLWEIGQRWIMIKALKNPTESRIKYGKRGYMGDYPTISFEDAIDQGYVYKENGTIVIGEQLCETCKDTATVREAGGRLFCGKECQKVFYSKK